MRIAWALKVGALSMALGVSPLAQADDDPLVPLLQDYLSQQLQTQGLEGQVEVTPAMTAMAACQAPSPFLPPRTALRGNVTVGVRCLSDQGREMPRYYRAHIGIDGDYVAARQDIAPGSPLTEQNLSVVRGDVTQLPAALVTDMTQLVGQRSTRRIAAGTPLQAQMAKPPVLISRNSRVSVTAQSDSFSATAKGTALDEGSQGDTLRVRMDSGKVINAVADAPGAAHVTL